MVRKHPVVLNHRNGTYRSLDLNIGVFQGETRLDETGQILEGRGVDGTTAGGFHPDGWMDG